MRSLTISFTYGEAKFVRRCFSVLLAVLVAAFILSLTEDVRWKTSLDASIKTHWTQQQAQVTQVNPEGNNQVAALTDKGAVVEGSATKLFVGTTVIVYCNGHSCSQYIPEAGTSPFAGLMIGSLTFALIALVVVVIFRESRFGASPRGEDFVDQD